jgi:hypothetical protein
MKKPVKKYFDSLLEADLAEVIIPPNKFIAGHDFRIGTTDIGGVGNIENILKTAEKYHFINSAGIDLRIGFATDDENGFIIKFNQNSLGRDGIYLYDIIDEVWYTVLLSEDVTGGLNFNKYSLINGAYVINGVLYWNDNLNEPRRLHLGAFMSAYGASPLPSPIDTDYVISFPVDPTEITLIKKPCVFAPSITKLGDSGFNGNFIAKNSFKFMVEYIHFEGEQAVLSTWSKASFFNTTTQSFNYIHVVLDPTEEVPQTVRFVRLIVQDGSTGKAVAVKTWDRLVASDNALINVQNLSFDFYGNMTGEAIDSPTQVRPFHSVPLLSGSQERAKNRTILVDNLEGYDTPKSTSLALSLPSPISLGFSTLNKTLIEVRHRNGNSGDGDINYAYVAYYVYLTEVVPVGWYEITASAQTTTPSSFPYPTLAAPGTYASVAFSALTFRGTTLDAVALATAPSGTWRWDIYMPGVMHSPNPVYTANSCSVTGISVDTYGVFLPESLHKAGIVFGDRYMRKCGVVESDSTINIPARNYAFSSGYSAINWSLATSSVLTEIPDWAYYYWPVKTILKPFFVAAFDDAPKYATRNATTQLLEFTATAYATNIVAIAINASALLQAGLGYVFTEGDQSIVINDANTRYEIPVIGQEGNYILLKAQDIGSLSGEKLVYRIYTPYKTSEQEPFWEVGDVFPITNATTPLRTYSQLTGSFRADTFALTRSFNGTTYFAEVMNPNDTYFQRWDTDAGRPDLITKLGQVRKPTGISFSNVYVQGTQTNGLSAFEGGNKQILPEDIGTIRKAVNTSKVQKDGSVLLIIAEQEVATVYIGEVMLTDTEGNQYWATSDKFIGQINVLRGGYGTSNHESVVSHKGMVAWYSKVLGCFVRYDNNGVKAISDNGMKRVANLFSQKYASLSVSEIEALGSRPFVFGGYDPYHDEIYFSIPSTESVPPKGYVPSYQSPDLPIIYPFDIYDGIGKVLVYKVEADQWGAPHSYETEGFVDIRDLLFSAKNGSMYKHNVNDGTANTFSSFYGVQVIPAIAFIVNEEVNLVKEFITLAIEGNTQPTFVMLLTEFPNLQVSDISEDSDEWIVREGIIYAKRGIMRDRLSPNVSGTFDAKLYTGDKMRGNWLKVYVEYETTQLLQIRYHNIEYVSHERGQI